MRPTHRSRRVAAVAALAVPALLLTACGSDGKNASSSNSSSSASSSASSGAAASTAPAASSATPAPKGDLSAVTVTGADDKPVVKIKGDKLSTDKTEIDVRKEGTGETIANGDKISAKIVVVNGANGTTVYDSYKTGQPESWEVGGQQMLAGLSNAVVGQKVGSRIIAAVPPKDAFGDQGQPNLKIGKSDTIVVLIDVVAKAPKPLPDVKGKEVAPKAGMPTVKAEKGKAAQITIPKTAAPTKLEVADLVEGDGAAVKKGQTVQVQYTGVLWKDGKKFDSSYDHGTKPTEFPIGVGSVIPAWDKALVGKKIGSRVLIVAPPADAYGDQGQPPAIPAKATLVFVVDILGAY